MMESQSGPISSLGNFEEWKSEPLEGNKSFSGSTCNIFRTLYEGKYVFIKRLKDDFVGRKSYLDVFRKEYVIGCTLNSEYFPQYIDYSEDDGYPVIMMEYIDGLNLKEFVKVNPRYFHDSRNIKRFLLQFLEALIHLHSHQVVHLDLKPENILMTRVNNDVRIVDLGYCYADSIPFTQGRTNNFAAPEQFSPDKHVDARTDIYAFGKILEYILKESEYKNRMYQKIANRCTHDDPSKRFQQERDIIRELKSTIWRNRLQIALSLATIIISLPLFYIFIHTNHYDFCYRDTHNSFYFNILSDKHEIELTGKYEWGNNYPSDISIRPRIIYDDTAYSVVSIGDSALIKSTLEAIEIPPTIRRIGSHAFAECPNITTLTIPDGVTFIGESACAGCTSLSVVRLPSTLKTIPRACFFDCRIFNISIPEGVERIERDAFVGNNFLTEVNLPSTLKHIDRGAFYHCYKLERFVIPPNVTTIGDFVLYECPNLKEIYNYAETPQTCTGIVQRNSFKGVVYVPANSVDAYRKAQVWTGLNIQAICKTND